MFTSGVNGSHTHVTLSHLNALKWVYGDICLLSFASSIPSSCDEAVFTPGAGEALWFNHSLCSHSSQRTGCSWQVKNTTERAPLPWRRSVKRSKRVWLTLLRKVASANLLNDPQYVDGTNRIQLFIFWFLKTKIFSKVLLIWVKS